MEFFLLFIEIFLIEIQKTRIDAGASIRVAVYYLKFTLYGNLPLGSLTPARTSRQARVLFCEQPPRIFLEIWGLHGFWKALFLYVLPLFIGSYLLEEGKPFGCLIGFFLGIHMMVGEFLEVPRRINMGNAGQRIEATPEIYWRAFWGMGIYWCVIFSLFFLALGIYVFVKNRKKPSA